MAEQHHPLHHQRILLTTAEVAVRLGLSVKTLQNWRCGGCGPRYLKIGGGAVRYPLVEVNAWIESSLASSRTNG